MYDSIAGISPRLAHLCLNSCIARLAFRHRRRLLAALLWLQLAAVSYQTWEPSLVVRLSCEARKVAAALVCCDSFKTSSFLRLATSYSWLFLKHIALRLREGPKFVSDYLTKRTCMMVAPGFLLLFRISLPRHTRARLTSLLPRQWPALELPLTRLRM
ncbi:hypothetical protein F4809DRAFT_587551, partial [Biscogniauxia mediterranea]